MSTDASQSQGGADAPASVNNPRSAAAAATAAANAISRTKQARARTRFFDLWAVVAAILLLAAIVYLLNILSVPVAILIWTVIIVFCLRGICLLYTSSARMSSMDTSERVAGKR